MIYVGFTRYQGYVFFFYLSCFLKFKRKKEIVLQPNLPEEKLWNDSCFIIILSTQQCGYKTQIIPQ